MSDFQICFCGVQPGYVHKHDCPYPDYCGGEREYVAWRNAQKKLFAVDDTTIDPAPVGEPEAAPASEPSTSEGTASTSQHDEPTPDMFQPVDFLPTPAQLAERIERAVASLRQARREFSISTTRVQNQEAHNTYTEAKLIVDGAIVGKNAEERAARLTLEMLTERSTLADLQRRHTAARFLLDTALDEFKLCQLVAGLLAVNTDEK